MHNNLSEQPPLASHVAKCHLLSVGVVCRLLHVRVFEDVASTCIHGRTIERYLISVRVTPTPNAVLPRDTNVACYIVLHDVCWVHAINTNSLRLSD